MATVQIRVSEQTRDRLQQIADRQHQSVEVIVQQAVDQFDNALFWSAFHRQRDDLRSDPVGWTEINDEFHELDATLLDGLDDEGDE
jgi:hypothetical protein